MSGSEFALIEWLRARTERDPRLDVGIGDDAAVYSTTPHRRGLIAVDMLVEGAHFTIPPASAREIGRKALAVNLSDIAAMAGVPTLAVVAVSLPRARGLDFARELHAAIGEMAAEYGVSLAGGDTNISDGGLTIAVTVLGEATERGPVLRSGARPGDWLMVTGTLGGSLAGRHLAFEPRVREALRLHEAADLHAMIDISDGLAADLHHILTESAAGAVLRATAIPISDAARAAAAANGDDDRSPLAHALGDGEDFELLFAVSPEEGRRLLDSPPIPLPLAHLGEITAERGCELIDASGQRIPLARSGWEHAF